MSPARRLEQTDVRTELGRRRLQRGMTQREMWEATGLSRATYLRPEHGRDENPPVRYLSNCAIVLGCQLEDLIEPAWREWWKRLPNDPEEPSRPEELWGWHTQRPGRSAPIVGRMAETITLYRPVGPEELKLIEESGYRVFPPRLYFQPIFYPVLNEEYARQIARDWNAKDAERGYAGYVTKFNVRADFAARYEPQQVGGRVHVELWVPAEELDEFNANIEGLIEVVAEYHGGPDGVVTPAV